MRLAHAISARLEGIVVILGIAYLDFVLWDPNPLPFERDLRFLVLLLFVPFIFLVLISTWAIAVRLAFARLRGAVMDMSGRFMRMAHNLVVGSFGGRYVSSWLMVGAAFQGVRAYQAHSFLQTAFCCVAFGICAVDAVLSLDGSPGFLTARWYGFLMLGYALVFACSEWIAPATRGDAVLSTIMFSSLAFSAFYSAAHADLLERPAGVTKSA
uniref:Uncharacterized protein n=1 Tax=mine drainage metagenome TaxID=410659 RepID=E6Q3Q4_9ZZZZ